MRGPIESGMQTKPSNTVEGQPVKGRSFRSCCKKDTPSWAGRPLSLLIARFPRVMCMRTSQTPQPRAKCSLHYLRSSTGRTRFINKAPETPSPTPRSPGGANALTAGMRPGPIPPSEAKIGALRTDQSPSRSSRLGAHASGMLPLCNRKRNGPHRCLSRPAILSSLRHGEPLPFET